MIHELLNMPIFLYITAGCIGLLLFLFSIIIVLCVKNSNKKTLLSAQQRQIDELSLQNGQILEVNSGLNADNTRLNTEIKTLQRYTEEKIAYIEKSKNEMAVKFRDISNEILRQQSQQLNDTQSTALNALLTPFREQMQSFKEEVQRANMENIKNKSSFEARRAKLDQRLTRQ